MLAKYGLIFKFSYRRRIGQIVDTSDTTAERTWDIHVSQDIILLPPTYFVNCQLKNENFVQISIYVTTKFYLSALEYIYYTILLNIIS